MEWLETVFTSKILRDWIDSQKRNTQLDVCLKLGRHAVTISLNFGANAMRHHGKFWKRTAKRCRQDYNCCLKLLQTEMFLILGEQEAYVEAEVFCGK